MEPPIPQLTFVYTASRTEGRFSLMEFDWDFANLDHIAHHKVEPEEAEEAATDPNAVPQPAHRGPRGQPRFAFVGATETGRLLVVVLEPRGEKACVVTARPANAEERRWYELQE